MPDEKIADLIERVERLDGPDRELDRAVHAYVCEHILRWQWKDVGPDYDGKNASRILAPPDMPKGFAYPRTGAIHPWYHVPDSPITGSLNAVLSLVERVRPGWVPALEFGDPGADSTTMRSHIAKLRPNMRDDIGWQTSGVVRGSSLASMPLAVLSALLRSIQG